MIDIFWCLYIGRCIYIDTAPTSQHALVYTLHSYLSHDIKYNLYSPHNMHSLFMYTMHN